jgi:hypothetical protein
MDTITGTTLHSNGRKPLRLARIGLFVSLGVSVLWFWYFRLQPWYYLFMLELEVDSPSNPGASRSDRIDDVVSLGERALPQTIDRIAEHSMFSKSAVMLPFVLKEIGESGHKALVEAIDQESNHARKVHLVEALVDAYGDFSRVNVWIDDLRRHPGNMPNALETYFIQHFGEGTPFLRQGYGKLNPQFLSWYKKRVTPTGPLPPLKNW